MALGTITIPSGLATTTANTTWGNKKVRIRNVQLTSGANYTTGGEAITASGVGLSKRIEAVIGSMSRSSDGTTSRTVSYDATNRKLLVYTTASAEAASNSDQSGQTATLIFIGT